MIFIDLKNNICESIPSLEIVNHDYQFAGRITQYEFNLELDSDDICQYVHDWYLLSYDHKMNCSTIKRDLHFLADDEQVYKLTGTLINKIYFSDAETHNMKCTVTPDLFIIDRLQNCPELISFSRDKKLNKILNES